MPGVKYLSDAPLKRGALLSNIRLLIKAYLGHTPTYPP
jgi:hypothetical protein